MEYVALSQLADMLGIDRSHARRYAIRHGFQFRKARDLRSGQLVNVLTREEAEALVAIWRREGFIVQVDTTYHTTATAPASRQIVPRLAVHYPAGAGPCPRPAQDAVSEAIQVDPKVVPVCTPLEDPVWAMPGEMVTVGCADQTSGGQVVAGSVVLGSQNFALTPTAGQIWSSQFPAPSNPGAYVATWQLDVQDAKGRAVVHAVPLQLIVVSPVPTPGQGLDVLGPQPGRPGKVRLVR